MIYAVVSNGNPKALAKYRSVREAFAKKHPNAQLLSFTGDTAQAEELFDLTSQKSFFGGAYLVSCYHLSENKELKEVLGELLEAMGASENHFLLFEEKLDTKILAQIEKIGTLYTFTSAAKREEYNIFTLPQKVGERDRRGAWVELQRAQRAGVSESDLLRPLLWQVRAILLASRVSAAESGLKPFVYNRAKSYAENYSRAELDTLSFSLAMLEPRVVAGEVELDIALETLVLNL